MDPFENHTFQPRLVMRRGDLATAVRRLVAMAAATNPALRKRLAAAAEDRGHGAHASRLSGGGRRRGLGVMPLLEGERFEVNRAVTGAEAVDAINRLRALFR